MFGDNAIILYNQKSNASGLLQKCLQLCRNCLLVVIAVQRPFPGLPRGFDFICIKKSGIVNTGGCCTMEITGPQPFKEILISSYFHNYKKYGDYDSRNCF